MAATPQILKEVVFTLATQDFSQDVLDAAVVPTPGPIQSVKTLDGTNHQDAEAESWGLRLRCVIDWSSTRPGLAYYLNNAKGTKVAFELKDTTAAKSTGKPSITGTVTLVPISYGGNGNQYAEAEVVLPLDGDPVLDATP